ncbi:MAG TPA: YggS family pyridoxal phosphate-dependent enzyme [Nocardioidaceae bacterium]|nr:YggS family pyridoxal phosphate-dependent enzyme [Nocardioidaceae bacterium]
MTAQPTSHNRRDEIAAGLETVQGRIAAACAAAGRSADEVTLTVVTKFFPASDVRHLFDLGVRDVGENRHQEAEGKAAECADLDLRWHFIGNLQSNKAAAVARYADVVESVDRPKLLPGLARGAQERGSVVDCLIQVNLDPEGVAGTGGAATGRGGARPADVVPLAERLAATDGLRLRGVMAVAPLDSDPAPAFATLAGLAADVRRVDPSATWVSAGMSGDLEAAIESGATHVRIGSAVLGRRPTIK